MKQIKEQINGRILERKTKVFYIYFKLFFIFLFCTIFCVTMMAVALYNYLFFPLLLIVATRVFSWRFNLIPA